VLLIKILGAEKQTAASIFYSIEPSGFQEYVQARTLLTVVVGLYVVEHETQIGVYRLAVVQT
jgi:hypothetical protein